MELKLIKIKEKKDGSADYNFEVSKEFKEFVKKYYNKKRYSDKLGKLAILEGLYNYIKKEKIKELDEFLEEAYKLNNIKGKK